MQYIDSNVFIYAVLANEKTEPKARLSKQILIGIAEGRMPAATSSLTWDEVVWSIRHEISPEIAIEEGARFLEFPNLRILSIDEKVVNRAQTLIETKKLKPRDSIHLACCMENSISEIISDDKDFDMPVGIKRIPLEKA